MTSQKPLTPEMLVPRLGEYLVERNIITREDLAAALQYQSEKRQNEENSSLIGQVLIEMGMVDRATLDDVITDQILQLRAALEENNRELEHRVQKRTAELQKALDKLSELDQLKSNFVANISHELRTPLTHVKGYLELLLTGDLGKPTSEQQYAMKTMERALQRLERLIEDLILFATAEHNQVQLRPMKFNISSLCQNIVNNYKVMASERKVDLQFKSDGLMLIAYGDSEKIAWVIQQLIDNSLKFTPARGSVQLVLEEEHRQVRCSIVDTGIGIPQNRIEEIFEPFHQLDSSSTRRYGGTGLGLSLVRKIIEAHGSSIEVESVIGKGSRFSFTLRTAKDTS